MDYAYTAPGVVDSELSAGNYGDYEDITTISLMPTVGTKEFVDSDWLFKWGLSRNSIDFDNLLANRDNLELEHIFGSDNLYLADYMFDDKLLHGVGGVEGSDVVSLESIVRDLTKTISMPQEVNT